MYRSGNKHRHEDTDKGIWPLDFLAEGYVSQNFQKKKWGGGTQGRLLKGGGVVSIVGLKKRVGESSTQANGKK